MKALALGAIRVYQRFLSPHKGFCCALRALTGGESCSHYGYRVIERVGLRRGLGLLDRRLALCGHAHRSARAARGSRPPPVRHPLTHRQRGECDLPCDADCAGNALDCACSSGDCNWGRGARSEAMEKEQRHLEAITERVRRRREDAQALRRAMRNDAE